MILSSAAIAAAKAHAREEFPKEACGLVVAGDYIPMHNIAQSPDAHTGEADCVCQLCAFEIDPVFYARIAARSPIEAVLHSHPNGPLYPSFADMQGQLATNVAWGIIALDEERVGEPLMWGADTPIDPIIGRQFMHGVRDCYSLVRDVFRLGQAGLEAQDVPGWPRPPILLPEVARADGWWNGADNFYEDLFTPFGFVEVTDPRPGDMFLCKVFSDKLNHAGVLLQNDQLLHHLPQRLSRREPSVLWARSAEKWIRYHA